MIHGSYDPRITNIRDPCDPTDLKDPTPDLRIRGRSRIRSRIIKLFSVGAGSGSGSYKIKYSDPDPDPDLVFKGSRSMIRAGSGSYILVWIKIRIWTCNLKNLIPSRIFKFKIIEQNLMHHKKLPT